MPTTTVSTRLDPAELKLLENLADSTGLDRSSLVRSLLRNGMKTLRMEQSVEAYRRDAVTLARAAEIAGMGIWDFLARMKGWNLDLHYDVEDLEVDMANADRGL